MPLNETKTPLGLGAGQTWNRRLLKGIAEKTVGLTTNQRDREKWLEQVLGSIPPGSRILDAGAGELQYKRFCGHLNYVGQDLAQYDGRGDGSGLQMGSWDTSRLDIVSDIADIPEPDGSFDAVLCVEVLEHIPAPLDALREFGRLLRPGGQLILTAPFSSLTHQAPFYFYSGFSRYFYQKWLPCFGFEITEIIPNGNYFDFLRQELERLKSVSEQYAPRLRPRYWLGYGALWILLRTLKRLSAHDTGSDHLLCYGYQVRAVKQ